MGNYKEFDLEEAKNGAILMTLTGHRAYITDFNYPNATYPLLGVVIYNGYDCRLQWTNSGKSEFSKDRKYDLHILSKTNNL